MQTRERMPEPGRQTVADPCNLLALQEAEKALRKRLEYRK